ncbi:MAG: hypothetical protein M1812_007300 [Candelaria pacifica]|nr:MAG: hypothetical protein M1812_007300 [Candelaria pacifica]
MSMDRNKEQLGGLLSYNEGVIIQGNSITTGRDVNINVTAGLARGLYRSSINAGETFQQLANDISSIAAALDVAKGSLLGSLASEGSGREFLAIVTGCDAVLKSTEVSLLEYRGLSPIEQKTWEKSAGNREQLKTLKKELDRSVHRLTLFNTSQSNVTSTKINHALQLLIEQIRAQSQNHTLLPLKGQLDLDKHSYSEEIETDAPPIKEQAACDDNENPDSREGSILTTYTAESLTVDERDNWRQLRKALEGVGITPQLFDQRQGFITSRIRELVVGGALEEESGLDSEESSKAQLAHKLIPERTGTAQDSNVFSSRSSLRTFHTCLDGSESGPSSLPTQTPIASITGRPTRADQILKSLGYYRQDRALLASILAEDINRMRTTLRKGANVNGGQNKKDRTLEQVPILLAAERGNTRIVLLLLDYTADIEVNTGACGSPLCVAAYEGHKEVVQLLLSHGANIEAKNYYDDTSLTKAASEGHTDVVQILLDHGANIEAKILVGWTSLICAASKGHTDVVQILLHHGANIEARDLKNWTSLPQAAAKGHTDVVQLLLDHGANIEAKARNDWTSLIRAANQGHTEMVQLLLDHGANIEAEDREGWTSLICAASKGYRDVVQLLLDHGANIEAKARTDWTSLIRAANQGHTEMVQLLLDHGANIEAEDLKGWTSLNRAAYWGHTEVVQLLLAHGASIESRDRNGYSALDFAKKGGNKKIEKLLLAHLESKRAQEEQARR